MRILFVVSGKDVPSTRFRILPYLPWLEQAGHTCDVAYSCPQKYEYFRAIGWRLSQRLKRAVRHWHVFLASRRIYDAIVIEREVFDDGSFDLEARFRERTGRLVLDIDDGVFLNRPEKFEQLTRFCDAAIGGNRLLVEYLESRVPRVELLPTCVSLRDYPARPPESQRAEVPYVGWIGTSQNVALLQVSANALRKTAESTPYKLVVVAPSAKWLEGVDLAGVDVDFRKWLPKTEVQQLRDMDVGLMPLADNDPWMKYKCGLKLIQYLAVGIPGIASPIGVNQEILDGNCVGRAASNDAQWSEALIELLQSPALRQELGAAGRKLVEQSYSIESNWQRFESVLVG